MLQSYGLDRELERHQAVRHRESVVVPHVHFMLAGRDLVMGGLGVKAHLVQIEHRLLSDDLPLIHGHQIEVTGGIRRGSHGVPLSVQIEQEELELGAKVACVPLLLGLIDHLFQHPAWIALEPVAGVIEDLAEQAGRLKAPTAGPRVYLERGEDGGGPHVRFLDRGVA